jgi:hypothetical protein
MRQPIAIHYGHQCMEQLDTKVNVDSLPTNQQTNRDRSKPVDGATALRGIHKNRSADSFNNKSDGMYMECSYTSSQAPLCLNVANR